MKWLPNALTILRCILAFVVGWMVLTTGFGEPLFTRSNCSYLNDMPPDCLTSKLWGGWPFVLFVAAALLDYFDGLAARMLNAVSAFGAWLDPLADKLLIGITLLALCMAFDWSIIYCVPTILIIGRDFLVTLIRSRIKGGVPVSRMAKWKTAIAMAATGGLLLFQKYPAFHIPETIAALGGVASLVLLYLAAALSVYTAWQYVRAAFRTSAET